MAACSQASPPTTSTQPRSSANSSDPANVPAATERPESGKRPDTSPPIANEKPTTPREDDWFADVTTESRVDYRYRNGREGGQYTILETVGGGVAMLDYDGDHQLDLYFPGGGAISSASPPQVTGAPPGLFRNLGEWKFAAVTEPAGLADPATFRDDYTHGAIAADYDRDGFVDLFVTAYGRCRLFRNQGDGTWLDDARSDATSSGPSFSGWSTAAAWADIDNDGLLDLYVGQYLDWNPRQNPTCLDARGQRDVCPPQRFPPAVDRLFRNVGDGTFQEVTEKLQNSAPGRALGVLAADLNGDGRVDFYVANDAGANFLYLGAADGSLVDSALTAGVAFQEFGLPEGSMGVDAGDFNGDGRADLWVTNFELEDNSLYVGEPDGLYRHATVSAGLAGVCFAQVGFGTVFDDLDGDGRQDLFVLNGNVFYGGGQSGYKQRSFLFRNREGKRFENATVHGGPYFSVGHAGRGAALGDLDNDGDLDLVTVHQNDPVTLLQNRRHSDQWVRLRLRGVAQNSEGIGATLRIVDGDRTSTRWVRSGAGYLSQFDPRMLVAARGPVDVTVLWPGGRRERFPQLSLGRTHEIVEGQGQTPLPEN